MTNPPRPTKATDRVNLAGDSEARIARVALPVPLNRLFDYLAAPGSSVPAPGTRVIVPFGHSQRVGIVVERTCHSLLPEARLKPIQRVLDSAPILNTELLSSTLWAAQYWLAPPGEALATALPQALRQARPLPLRGQASYRLSESGRNALATGQRRGHTRALLERLAAAAVPAAQLYREQPAWRDAARRLLAAGLLERCFEESPEPQRHPQAGPVLHPAQQQAIATVTASLGTFQSFLLEGVTGSGKTEVYLQLAAEALRQGLQVLVLVPEIGLSAQTVARFEQRLGIRVPILHSGLADGARARAWLHAASGAATVLLGTRSAVFAPLPKAGLIIIDEEHDTSYKQQEGFRYHARDLALVRAQALQVPIVLGSATPSLESLANVQRGRYQLLTLRERVNARPPPKVEIIDLRRYFARDGLSAPLLAALQQTFSRGEQALVFRNRRGYAPVLLCRQCGWHAECQQCSRPLTLHEQPHHLQCHHCGARQPVPTQCPTCASPNLLAQGHGTERLEAALAEHFPSIPLLRVDRASTPSRMAMQALEIRLPAEGPVLLIGTQMLAKGHDLPRLTLVAISSLDEGLYSIDFRAQERMAQLIVQVAGRSGRASYPGRVLLQTHHPDHPLLSRLLQGGYSATAAELLEERRITHLPPYGQQALLRARAGTESRLQAFLDAALAALPAHPGIEVAGPMPAPIPRLRGMQRGQLLLEATSRARLHQVLAAWVPIVETLAPKHHTRWSLDVDPVDLY